MRFYFLHVLFSSDFQGIWWYPPSSKLVNSNLFHKISQKTQKYCVWTYVVCWNPTRVISWYIKWLCWNVATIESMETEEGSFSDNFQNYFFPCRKKKKTSVLYLHLCSFPLFSLSFYIVLKKKWCIVVLFLLWMNNLFPSMDKFLVLNLCLALAV